MNCQVKYGISSVLVSFIRCCFRQILHKHLDRVFLAVEVVIRSNVLWTSKP